MTPAAPATYVPPTYRLAGGSDWASAVTTRIPLSGTILDSPSRANE
jgi:hypothetical protein